MDYNDLVRDFAERTRANLRYVENAALAAPSEPVFEVTQLVNSLLGLLVFPQQRFIESIPEIPLAELVAVGWPTIRPSRGSPEGDQPPLTLRELVRYLRNAIAHCNLEFVADSRQELTALRLWNLSRGVKTWEVVLSVDDLRAIADRFCDLILSKK